jgi:hypothetical protein
MVKKFNIVKLCKRGAMKYIKLSIVVLFVFLMANGCSGEKSVHGGVGFIPKITNVSMIKVDKSTNPDTYTTGDQVTFTVMAEISLDHPPMKTLLVTEFLADSDTPYKGPYKIILPTQDFDKMIYSDLGPITLSGPPGHYRMDIQIETTNGSISDAFSVNFSQGDF